MQIYLVSVGGITDTSAMQPNNTTANSNAVVVVAAATAAVRTQQDNVHFREQKLAIFTCNHVVCYPDFIVSK